VAESKLFLPELALEERLRRLLASGGFPEAFLNPDEAARLRNDRMEIVTREDLRDLSRVTPGAARRISSNCCVSA